MAEAMKPPTGPLHRFARNNGHLDFVFEHLAPLAPHGYDKRPEARNP